MNEFEYTTTASGPADARNETATTNTPAEPVVWSRFGDRPLPTLPKMAAVNRAYKAGLEFGLPEGFASALAHSVTDPAELRGALNRPTRVAVTGGELEVIDVDVFTPGVVPLPTNNRTMDMRVYPAGGSPGNLRPLEGPRSDHGTTSRLWIRALTAAHALDEAKRGADYILSKNPLMASVAARGIMMPITVVHFELQHADGTPPMPLLGAADGSSRLAAAHAVLNLADPHLTHYEMPTNRSQYRRMIGTVCEADLPELGASAAKRMRASRNALVTPARIFLRFTPYQEATYHYARALSAYVGMLHVDPPRPWTPTGRLESMAESVLDVLHSAEALDGRHHDYLAGLLTPDDAKAAGLPTERDEQAAFVLSTLLHPDLHDLVDQGIMGVTAKNTVSPGRRTDVAAELALRPTRSAAVTSPLDNKGGGRTSMRAAYLRATRLRQYAIYPWHVTGNSPDELLNRALMEYRLPESQQDDPAAWAARLELAALAQYHLTAFGALSREPHGGGTDADNRGPHDILDIMLNDEQGLRILHQAVLDGRAGIPPRLVDEHGALVRGQIDESGTLIPDADGPEVRVTDAWLRYHGFPSGPVAFPATPIEYESPMMKAARLQHEVRELVAQLASHVDDLERIPGQVGGSLLRERGWPTSETDDVRKDLMHVDTMLAIWGDRAAAQAGPDSDADDLDYEDD